MNPFKKIKGYIDENFRLKVTPVPGSIVYTDSDGDFKHSGVIGQNGEIITLKEETSNSATIIIKSLDEFMEESEDKRVYVSSNFIGAVGNKSIAGGAEKHIGDRDMYRHTFENCHSFSQKCLYYSTKKVGFLEKLNLADIIEKYTEIQLAPLKETAKEKIGATKWLLWNLERDRRELDKSIDKDIEKYRDIRLNDENIQDIKEQKKEIERYIEEIKDENIDTKYLKKIIRILKIFEDMEKNYEKTKDMLKVFGGGFSLNELETLDLSEFNQVIKEMENNNEIKKLVEKLGREFKSEEEDIKITKIRNHNIKEEVYGIKKGDDISRILSSELAYLCDEDMEYLFYIKLYEKGLLNYSLSGMEEKVEKEEKKASKGPIIVALDTSGSMFGKSLIKSKALLLSIFKTLQKEKRKLYILLFGDMKQIKERDFEYSDNVEEIISFINSGFGGGTNFDTPLKRGVEILKNSPKYEKADILMITDGECEASKDMKLKIKEEKSKLKFNIYSVITVKSYNKINDGFSDEIVVI